MKSLRRRLHRLRVHLRLFGRWLGQNYWLPVSERGRWGIYHPVDWHEWSYLLTYRQACWRCLRRNVDPNRELFQDAPAFRARD